ncbi:MAG: sigma-54-dependent Fis family transcriptional regulator [Sedimentisphaerales bacterium]|nr:sigma-54-dependent Fis family transcriptional regulator [Sedimentisphaerales bacterium]
MSSDIIILIVDDERNHADGLAEALEEQCARAIPVYTAEDAIEILNSEEIDIVVTDLKLENEEFNGLTILDVAKDINLQTEVILITAYGTIETCKDAIKKGAFDYLVKPVDIDQLRMLIDQAAKKVSTAKAKLRIVTTDKDGFVFAGVRGQGPKTKSIFEVLKRVAPSDISVLIEGPSGSGKELIARAIHDNSKRKDMSFKPLNCAGLTESLLESELFGHTKGAFTGATADRKGLFEIADKGTLFLDEIGDMPLNMQAKLLRVLEDGIVTPVGSDKNIVVDVRFISATNHDLVKLVDEKKFRQDLFFRIKGVSINVPALKDRREDIPEFIDFFIGEAAAKTGSNVTGITDSAREILANYDWPGNIRQLRNCIRTMVVMADSNTLDVKHIPVDIYQVRQLTGNTRNTDYPAGMSLNEIEKQAIIDTLKKTNNNREKTAKILGIGERTLYRKIKEYDL